MNSGDCGWQWISNQGWVSLWSDCDPGTDCHEPSGQGKNWQIVIVICT
jgi:hypothetical protein